MNDGKIEVAPGSYLGVTINDEEIERLTSIDWKEDGREVTLKIEIIVACDITSILSAFTNKNTKVKLFEKYALPFAQFEPETARVIGYQAKVHDISKVTFEIKGKRC